MIYIESRDFVVHDRGTKIEIEFARDLMLVELSPVARNIRGELDRHGAESVRNLNIVTRWVGGTLAGCFFQADSFTEIVGLQTTVIPTDGVPMRVTIRLLPTHKLYRGPVAVQTDVLQKFVAARLCPGS